MKSPSSLLPLIGRRGAPSCSTERAPRPLGAEGAWLGCARPPRRRELQPRPPRAHGAVAAGARRRTRTCPAARQRPGRRASLRALRARLRVRGRGLARRRRPPATSRGPAADGPGPIRIRSLGGGRVGAEARACRGGGPGCRGAKGRASRRRRGRVTYRFPKIPLTVRAPQIEIFWGRFSCLPGLAPSQAGIPDIEASKHQRVLVLQRAAKRPGAKRRARSAPLARRGLASGRPFSIKKCRVRGFAACSSRFAACSSRFTARIVFPEGREQPAHHSYLHELDWDN